MPGHISCLHMLQVRKNMVLWRLVEGKMALFHHEDEESEKVKHVLQKDNFIFHLQQQHNFGLYIHITDLTNIQLHYIVNLNLCIYIYVQCVS